MRSRRGVCELAALAGALTLTLAMGTGAGAGPARAGTASSGRVSGTDEPDLALVLAGDTGRTRAVPATDPDFARLRGLLQPTYSGTERVSEVWAEGRYPPVRVTVIWGLTGVGGWPDTDSPPGGDVAMERQDQLFLDEEGTPWVRSDPSPEIEDDDIRWHRVSRADYDRLERAGVFAAGSAGTGRAGAGAGRRDEVRWAVAGLAVGLGVGAGGVLLMRRAADRREAGPPQGPRQELNNL
ncbi:hypothetical protein PV735_34865 [Streptomyces turgidiscabies]|nr:hypothetical protein [Streptomyces turgidiscabies]MDX3497835.1 hypothetical protein [Streptomyces turgidiscabies]